MTLEELKPGDKAEVLKIDCPFAGRLTDLGLVPGTEVTCLYSSPLGDPKAYMIRGAVVAIRRHDVEQVTVGWRS